MYTQSGISTCDSQADRHQIINAPAAEVRAHTHNKQTCTCTRTRAYTHYLSQALSLSHTHTHARARARARSHILLLTQTCIHTYIHATHTHGGVMTFRRRKRAPPRAKTHLRPNRLWYQAIPTAAAHAQNRAHRMALRRIACQLTLRRGPRTCSTGPRRQLSRAS